MTVGYEGGLQAGFLVAADGSVEPLGNLGFPFTAATAIARDRGAHGCSRLSNDPPSDPVDHAFHYRTGTGIADVHPSPQWKMSCAHAETARGVVLGSASQGVRDHAPDVYSTGPGWGLRRHLRAVDAQALVPSPLSFLLWDPGAAIKTTNDALETVDNMVVLDATNPLLPFRTFTLPFYHHRLRGTFLLQEILDAAAPGVGRASRVEAISPKGTIALEIAVPQAPPLDDLTLLALLIPES